MIVLFLSCEEPEATNPPYDISSVKNINLIITSLYPDISGREYWRLPNNMNIVADSIYFNNDTLCFSGTNCKLGKLVIDKNTQKLDYFSLKLYYGWDRIWYDYSVPKWDPNYRHDDYVESIMILQGNNYSNLAKDKLNYLMTGSEFQTKWTSESELLYNHSRYYNGLSNQLFYMDSVRIEIIVE